MNQQINKLFISFSKRAEKVDHQTLVDSFVDVGPLFTVLSTTDNQVLYGRRGTGKTHALVYLAEKKKEAGDIPVYIDLRQVGSTGGIYSDPIIPFSERATRLLIDTLVCVHDELIDESLKDDSHLDLNKVAPILDEMAEAISEVTVSGPIEEEMSGTGLRKTTTSEDLGFSISPKTASFSVSSKTGSEQEEQDTYRLKRAGTRIHRINFGRVGDVFTRLMKALNGVKLWIVLDEWSVIPLELQPYLSDLLRRSLFPVPGITVKIGAIEKRSSFQLTLDGGDYIGIELGGDASADLNMDDFMVFENDETRAVAFFQNMIFRHFQSLAEENIEVELPTSERELIRTAFTQENVFRELVRAAEGIPRDALYILSMASQADFSKAISIDTVRKASKTWYQRDKETAVSANQRALQLLHWIIDNVIAHRRSRAFLLQRTISNHLIDKLFDARVLHLLKRNISAHDKPGVRYDVYKIDYGCYVDLLLTAKSPLGLLETETGTFVDVPPDDYRAIRRAILDIDEFEKEATN
ncbi:hypothetical protein FY034_05085 [Trichlorobacter lovleyi]|uniref:ORC-CDC6 family AAA ATPase n=1 Tax=Trichlorobacter lovleyi TaxID=313985 RepID=UPI002240B5A2|nr:hypothetical protein [Trichlorobacter lovleyi]QOX78331.1 hypothetical protein FY034_05085 [Trichlorobacter lovleyi]